MHLIKKIETLLITYQRSRPMTRIPPFFWQTKRIEEDWRQVDLHLRSPCFLNKINDILENHSESLSFSLSLQEERVIEKKRETQNDSLECQYIYSKSPGPGWKRGPTVNNVNTGNIDGNKNNSHNQKGV